MLYIPDSYVGGRDYDRIRNQVIARHWAQARATARNLPLADEVKDDAPGMFITEQAEYDGWMRTIVFFYGENKRPMTYRERMGDIGDFRHELKVLAAEYKHGRWTSTATVGKMKQMITEARHQHGSAAAEMSEVMGEVDESRDEIQKVLDRR